MFQLEWPEPDIAVISIDDPRKAVNILSRAALAELERLLDELEPHSDVAGLILRSRKAGNFIAGADLTEFIKDIDAPREQVVALSRRGHELFGRLARMPFVTVAAIDGVCVGGGAEVALWCDRRIMAANEATSFGFPEVKLGILPGWGGTARTPRVIGLANAVELITSGEPVDARSAFAMGLADDVTTTAGESARDDKNNRASDQQSLLDAAIRLVRAERDSKAFLADRQRWAGPIAISETELGFLGATASAYIQAQTKGHYPAPLAALEALLAGATVDLAEACQIESEAFAPLFGSAENRALLNVFFLRDHNKKQAEAAGAGGAPRVVRAASVIGAGVMGQGIAAANIKRGIPVALGDVSAEAVGRGVQATLAEASYNKKTKGPDVTRALELSKLLNGTTSDEELAVADIVVEAVYEDAKAKRDVYERLEPRLAADAVLCSNTSTIPITTLAAGLKRPQNFCGLHFFNPVRMMPLVEVIRGAETSDGAIALAVGYARRLGKSPIVVNDGPGFVVNRVLLPYMNEALLLLEEGATIKQVDRAATSFGMPMGPITLYDTVGLDIAVHAGGVLAEAFPDRVASSKILPAMTSAGRLGKKAGRGFFDYGGKQKNRGQESPETEAIIAGCRRDQRKFSSEELIDRLFLPMLLEATRVLEDGVAASVEDVDLALIYGIGFPPFRGGLFFWADSVGADAILQKLDAYKSLGERFAPTRLLEQTASKRMKFYDRSNL